ncbi:MAG: tetratricopeptide repeat protein [Crocinitomicaceae bacterium]|nr:tetratricopeptide repeat protein [Crocinitomicaceae bacterium]
MKTTAETSKSDHHRLPTVAVLSILLILVLICLFPTFQNGWVNWDDPAYVLKNPLIQDLSSGGIYTLFATGHQVGLYHPLTLISLGIDYQIWGVNAFGFHLTNLIFHLFNTFLAYYFFKKIQTPALAAFVGALLFGMHPMHVESVAWISARKDVLYTFFFLITLISYVYYSRGEQRNKILWYSVALLAFICSLLSKSLGFTLPIILLLLDYLLKRKITTKVLLEKLPFFILSVLALIMAKYGQQASDSMNALTEIPLEKTIFIGSYNVLEYLFKVFAPINLSSFHPFPFRGSPALSMLFYASMIPFCALLFFLFRWFKRSPKIFFGIALFLITISPVLQIIPFGKTISSERYTYVPYIGLFYLVGLGIQFLLSKKFYKMRFGFLGVIILWFLFLAFQTRQQSKVWKDSETLWSKVIEQYPESEWAYMSRGMHRFQEKDINGARQDLDKSISLSPIPQALYERGLLCEQEEGYVQAIDLYNQSLILDPSYAKSHLNLGVIYSKMQNSELAFEHFKAATEYDDSYGLAHFNLAISYKIKGQVAEALTSFTRAIELEPNNPLYIRHRGVLYYNLEDYPVAIADFERAMPLEPNSGEPYFLRSQSYFMMGNVEQAVIDAKRAEQLGKIIPEDYKEMLLNNQD